MIEKTYLTKRSYKIEFDSNIFSIIVSTGHTYNF